MTDHGKYCCCTNCSNKRKKERTHTFGIEIKTTPVFYDNIHAQNDVKKQLDDRIKTMKKNSESINLNMNTQKPINIQTIQKSENARVMQKTSKIDVFPNLDHDRSKEFNSLDKPKDTQKTSNVYVTTLDDIISFFTKSVPDKLDELLSTPKC